MLVLIHKLLHFVNSILQVFYISVSCFRDFFSNLHVDLVKLHYLISLAGEEQTENIKSKVFILRRIIRASNNFLNIQVHLHPP